VGGNKKKKKNDFFANTDKKTGFFVEKHNGFPKNRFFLGFGWVSGNLRARNKKKPKSRPTKKRKKKNTQKKKSFKNHPPPHPRVGGRELLFPRENKKENRREDGLSPPAGGRFGMGERRKGLSAIL